MAAFALRWILMEEAVTVVIPGAKSPEQAKANAAASGLPALSPAVMAAARGVYDRRIKAHVHGSW
jgi:aryl-alcohol dehydrogenase-like predicted oxidoreductase